MEMSIIDMVHVFQRWQMPPFDYMRPPSRGPPYPQYGVPPPGPRAPGPYSHPQMTPPQPPQSPQSPGPSPSPNQTPKKNETKDEMEEEHWKEKRMQRTEEMSTAIQRARQRREDEEKKMENDRSSTAFSWTSVLSTASKVAQSITWLGSFSVRKTMWFFRPWNAGGLFASCHLRSMDHRILFVTLGKLKYTIIIK